MGIFSTIGNFFSKEKKEDKKKVKDRELESILDWGTAFPNLASWTSTRYEQVRAFKRWNYVAIDTRASTVARRAPNVSLVKHSSKVDKLKVRGIDKRKALTPLMTHEALEPLPDNHPLVRLLRDPNEPDTGFSLWYETSMFLDLCGIAYWWVPKNRAGLPVAIWVLPSHWVHVYGHEGQIEGYELRPTEGNYLKKFIPREDVIVFRCKNPISKIDGKSKLEAVDNWSDVQTAIDESRVQAFHNGTFPTLAIQFDGTLNDPSDEMLRRIEAKLISRYVGTQNSNKPLWLPPGVKTIPLSILPNQMVWGENAKETRNNILAAFKVPPAVAGIFEYEQLDYKSQNQAYYEHGINPHCSMMSQVATECLARPYYGEDVRIWWEDFCPDDREQKEREIKTDMMISAITTNELRIMRGREPYPFDWADEPFKPVNMEPLTGPFGGEHQDDEQKPDSNLPEQPRTNEENE